MQFNSIFFQLIVIVIILKNKKKSNLILSKELIYEFILRQKQKNKMKKR
jgi:hypothetical protein